MAKKDKQVNDVSVANGETSVPEKKTRARRNDSDRLAVSVKFTAEQRAALLDLASKLSEETGLKVGLSAAAQSVFSKSVKQLTFSLVTPVTSPDPSTTSSIEEL